MEKIYNKLDSIGHPLMIIGGIIGTYLLSIGDMAVFGFNSAFLRTPIAVESVRMDMKDNLNCITGNLRNFQSSVSPPEQTLAQTSMLIK